MLAIVCTFCHSATAEQVRLVLVGPDLLLNAALAVAPMPVLFAAIWLVPGMRRDR